MRNITMFFFTEFFSGSGELWVGVLEGWELYFGGTRRGLSIAGRFCFSFPLTFLFLIGLFEHEKTVFLDRVTIRDILHRLRSLQSVDR